MAALLKMLRFVKKYTSFIILSFVLLMVSVMLDLVQPKLIQWAVDSGMQAQSVRLVILGGLGILGAALLGSGFNMASGFMLIRSAQGMGYEIRNSLYRKVMSFSFGNLDNWRTGELMVRMYSDVNTVRMFVRMGLLMIVRSIVTIIGALAFMFTTNVRLATIMAIFMPVVLILFFGVASIIRPMYMKVRTRLDEMNNVLQENLAGAKVVRAFSRQDTENRRFREKNRNYLKISLKVGYTISMVFPLLMFIGNIAVLMTLWIGGSAVIENILRPIAGGMTIGQLLAFNNYAMMSMFPVFMLGMVLSFIAQASASAIRLDAMLAEEPQVREKPGAVTVSRFKGGVEFRKVCFNYGEGENAVNDVDLVVEPGQKIGVLGTTGSGKSSLVYLIPRLYDPQKGEVLVDGTNVKDIAFSSLRKRIAVVLQETILLSGTIEENVRFGRPEAAAEEVERAAEIACAREFIIEKEGKWQEPVGERGMGLSGGQRQRVAIARAVLSDPDILILDDATSSVDLETERQIVKNIYREFPGKTILIISQKINTVRMADKILIMENGKITGEGSHDELLQSSHMYKEIFDTQSAQIH